MGAIVVNTLFLVPSSADRHFDWAGNSAVRLEAAKITPTPFVWFDSFLEIVNYVTELSAAGRFWFRPGV